MRIENSLPRHGCALLTSLLLAGCASTKGTIAPQGRSGSDGIVYVNRADAFVALGAAYSVVVDGRSAGQIGNAGCVKLRLRSGTRKIVLRPIPSFFQSEWPGEAIRVKVAPGSTTYVYAVPRAHLPGPVVKFYPRRVSKGRRC